MRSTFGLAVILGLLLAAGLPEASVAALAPAPAPAGGGTITVLQTPRLLTDLGTIWRYYETWQSDVVRWPTSSSSSVRPRERTASMKSCFSVLSGK